MKKIEDIWNIIHKTEKITNSKHVWHGNATVTTLHCNCCGTELITTQENIGSKYECEQCNIVFE